jgi:hypothetical protein
VPGGAVHDHAHAACLDHRRNTAQMVEDVTPVGMGPGVLLSRGAGDRPLKIQQLPQSTTEWRILTQC